MPPHPSEIPPQPSAAHDLRPHCLTSRPDLHAGAAGPYLSNSGDTTIPGLQSSPTLPVYPPTQPPNMSGRKLGGGRILGSGKGLAPRTPPGSSAQRATSPSAPSDSTLSLNSSSAASGPDPMQDLASNISLGGPSKVASSTELVCPICEEEMVRTSPALGCCTYADSRR